MFNFRNVASAVAVAGILGMGAASGAHAVSVDLSTLVADFGNGAGGFNASNQGDLDVSAFSFGPILYDGAFQNPNGITLTTTDLATAQASTATSNGFTNGFTFNTHSATPGFNFSAQVNEQAPGLGAGAGFLDFRVTFLDVTGSGAVSGGNLTFTQAEIDAASVLSEVVLTNSVDGTINFNPITDLPFFQAAGGDAQILALVSGTAFSNPGSAVAPNYIVSASVPLPAPVVLLISALIGLGYLGRRKARV